MSSTAPPLLHIPPLRTDLQEPQQSASTNSPPGQAPANGSAPQHRTAKEWYYYWDHTGRQVNQNTQNLAALTEKVDELVTYGQHATRPAPSAMPDGAIFVEADRGYVIYQNAYGAWHYCAGTMWGTMSPDARPTDLGVDDAGFEYRSTDQPPQAFIWSGSAWVAVPAETGDVQAAYASGSLTLTLTPTLIPGTSFTLNRAGRYLITGNFTFVMIADAGSGLYGRLVANGIAQGYDTISVLGTNYDRSSVSQQWVYQAASAGLTVSLEAYKDSGSGTSETVAGTTSITALWVSL